VAKPCELVEITREANNTSAIRINNGRLCSLALIGFASENEEMLLRVGTVVHLKKAVKTTS
jgi:hypothetical protein